jgi:acyl-CoA reductase-like NAD-dependent aldehyde dehydrogenase
VTVDAVSERGDVFIGGALVRSRSRRRVELFSPATGESIGAVPAADAGDVDRAVSAARAALHSWRQTAPSERAAHLRALAGAYEARKHEIGALVAHQNGSPRWWTVQENERGAPAVYRSYADVAASLEVEQMRHRSGGRSLIRRDPVGVVGAIVPWNSPQVLLAMKIGAALAAGCTVVAKPSPETSLDSYLVAEIVAEIGLPPGVVNIVTGDRETGEAIVRHPGIDKVAFTGSTAAGRSIASLCGESLKPVSAELGGKSAAVLLEDADLDAFAAAILGLCVPFSGQVCYACTRVLTPAARYTEVLEAVVSTLRGLRFGDPRDPATELGPLVSAKQIARVEGYVRSGLDEGAEMVIGGQRGRDHGAGYYLPPTVFTKVSPAMRIFREEIFGPVLSVVPYRDEDEAVALHDATDYGLHGAVFSADVERATALARRLETGGVQVNTARGAGGLSRAALKSSGIGMGGAPDIDGYLLAREIALPD